MKQKGINWNLVEMEFRAGIKTLRVLGDEFGVSAVSIHKRARRYGWSRDLRERIRLRAEAMVNNDMVNSLGNNKALVTQEREVVQASAELQANVIRLHRKTLAKGQVLVEQFLAELESETELTLSSRADILKKLAEAMKNFIAMERQSFGLDALPPADDSEQSEISNMSTKELRQYVIDNSRMLLGVEVVAVIGG